MDIVQDEEMDRFKDKNDYKKNQNIILINERNLGSNRQKEDRKTSSL